MKKPLVAIKLFENCGDLKAFADLTIPTKYGEITIHRFKVLQAGKKRPWVAFPQISYSKIVRNPLLAALAGSKDAGKEDQGLDTR